MAGRKPTAGAVVQALGIGIGLLAMVGGFAFIAVQYRPYAVPTGSMEPTVMAGQTVVAERASGNDVGRGDIVVFKDSDWGNTDLVKRVIGVGGDHVRCCDAQGRVSVNGTVLDETYLDENPTVGRAGPADQSFSTVVPAGRLWLLGDNRSISEDSRAHLDQLGGTVPTSAVIGRVEGVVFPVSSVHTIDRTTVFDALPDAHSASDHGPLGLAAYASVGGAVLVLITAGAGTVAGMVTRRRTREA